MQSLRKIHPSVLMHMTLAYGVNASVVVKSKLTFEIE
jgi:hypothetical protein